MAYTKQYYRAIKKKKILQIRYGLISTRYFKKTSTKEQIQDATFCVSMENKKTYTCAYLYQ